MRSPAAAAAASRLRRSAAAAACSISSAAAKTINKRTFSRRPIYRSIDPNGRYRSVCVRLCDGFFYPIHYSTYGSMLGEDQQSCQSNCAAPAELYVYRNPGQEIEQAVSLNGSAYMDLPVALRYRKEYVNGCSCKQAEYNPTEIEAANKRAEADATAKPGKAKQPRKRPHRLPRLRPQRLPARPAPSPTSIST